MMTSSIPMVDVLKCGLHITRDEDISEQDFRDIGDRLVSALSPLGIAYLSNHAIPWSDVDRLNKIADDYFELPEDEQNFYRGGAKSDNALVGRSRKHLEQEGPVGLRVVGEACHTKRMKWSKVPKFKETQSDFASKAVRLLSRLLKALGSGLKLKDKDYLVKVHSLMNKKHNSSELYSVIYLPTSTNDHIQSEERIVRMHGHVDVDTLTLIFQDSVGGLQAQSTPNKFVDVTPIPGTIILNVGMVLQAWTENRLKAVGHRVCTPEDPKKRNQIRRSIIYSCQANSDIKMKNLEFENEKTSDDEPSEVPVTLKEFIKSVADRRNLSLSIPITVQQFLDMVSD